MFKIILNGKRVGNSTVEKSGLYYSIRCECVFLDKKPYRIVANDGKTTVDLGICVPEGNRFIIKTKIPVKRLNLENAEFMAVPKIESTAYSVEYNCITYLDKLETARLRFTDGQPFIILD